MSKDAQCQSGGEDFVLGAAAVGIAAAIHNANKNEQHQRELQQVYWQGIQRGRGEMAQRVADQDAELGRLRQTLRQADTESAKDKAEIARLKGLVKELTEKLRWQAEPLVLPDADENNKN
jgi:hypothetical protein